MEIVDGLDQIQARYSEEFVVEASHKLLDGLPMAYKCAPLKPIALMAQGISWPIISGEKNGDAESAREDPEFWGAVRRVVARSVVAARQVGKDENGFHSLWQRVEVLCERQPNPKAKVREIHIDSLDVKETIGLIWVELMHRFQLQQIDDGSGERDNSTGVVIDSGNGSEGVRKVATRNRVGAKRRSRK